MSWRRIYLAALVFCFSAVAQDQRVPPVAQGQGEEGLEVHPYLKRVQGVENKAAIPFAFSLMANLTRFVTQERQLRGSTVDEFAKWYDTSAVGADAFIEQLLSIVTETEAYQRGAREAVCERTFTTAEEWAGGRLDTSRRRRRPAAATARHRR